MDFQLHQRLAKDTTWLGDLKLCRILLSKDNFCTWLILVPMRKNKHEIHHLTTAEQQQLTQELSLIAQLVETQTQADKINIAAIGNLVEQLHLHIVARFKNDALWPKPIWGNTQGILRAVDEQTKLTQHWQTTLSLLNDFVIASN